MVANRERVEVLKLWRNRSPQATFSLLFLLPSNVIEGFNSCHLALRSGLFRLRQFIVHRRKPAFLLAMRSAMSASMPDSSWKLFDPLAALGGQWTAVRACVPYMFIRIPYLNGLAFAAFVRRQRRAVGVACPLVDRDKRTGNGHSSTVAANKCARCDFVEGGRRAGTMVTNTR